MASEESPEPVGVLSVPDFCGISNYVSKIIL